MSFELIKRNYDRGLWTYEMVLKTKEKGFLTEQQFLEIVGKNK